MLPETTLQKTGNVEPDVEELHRFVFRIAKRFEIALDAHRFAGLTDFAAVPDQLMGKQDPFFLRDDLHQVLLDLLGIFVPGQIEPAATPLDRGCPHDPSSHPTPPPPTPLSPFPPP